MMGSNRGAARVSAVWVIALGVLALAALVFAFIAQSDLSAERDKVTTAEKAQQTAEETAAQLAGEKRSVSEVLGWYNRESADPLSDVASVQKAIEGLRESFGDLGETDQDFEALVPKVVAAHAARGNLIAELQNRVTTLEGEVKVANEALAQVKEEKDGLIAELRQQVVDETEKANQRAQELERRLATAQSELSDRDTELRTVQAKMLDDRRTQRREVMQLQTRINELARANSWAREPFASLPDGKILAVSDSLPLAWIDLGATNRLVRGMRFRVESGTAGDNHVKAYCEVTRVDRRQAEVAIVDQVDRLDPVVAGDYVVNPLYDPEGGRNAVLAGRFSGAYGQKEIVGLLQSMGIHVQDKLDLTTHFLIVGSELYVDPETEEPFEEPVPVSSLPVYKEAESLGVQIIPVQDIRHFFRIEAS